MVLGFITVNDNHRVHFWYLLIWKKLFWKKSWILEPKICTKPVCTKLRCHRIKTKSSLSHPSFNQRIVIVTLYELACSNNTSLLKPSFLRVSSELVCCTQYWHYYVFFPYWRKHHPCSLYFVMRKKYIYVYYLLLYELQFLEGFLSLRKTVTDCA